jgi:hypothetical protein
VKDQSSWLVNGLLCSGRIADPGRIGVKDGWGSGRPRSTGWFFGGTAGVVQVEWVRAKGWDSLPEVRVESVGEPGACAASAAGGLGGPTEGICDTIHEDAATEVKFWRPRESPKRGVRLRSEGMFGEWEQRQR